jgi:hypothetical protein
VPATEAATIDSDPRIALIQPLLDRMSTAAPELAQVQRLDCTAPGECNTGLMYNFTSTNYYAEFGTRAHSEWIIGGGPTQLYRDHKRLLQQMQWKGPWGRWLLKAPQHLFDLPGLLRTYPDARIIWTHRDPVATFSSLASMLSLVQRSVRLEPDPHELGDMVVRLWSKAILNAIEARSANPAIERIIVDVPHHEIVRSPVNAMRSVYERVEQPFTPAVEKRLQAFATHDRAQRLGRHRHEAKTFGIDPVAVRQLLSPYYARFGRFVTPPSHSE